MVFKQSPIQGLSGWFPFCVRQPHEVCYDNLAQNALGDGRPHPKRLGKSFYSLAWTQQFKYWKTSILELSAYVNSGVDAETFDSMPVEAQAELVDDEPLACIEKEFANLGSFIRKQMAQSQDSSLKLSTSVAEPSDAELDGDICHALLDGPYGSPTENVMPVGRRRLT